MPEKTLSSTHTTIEPTSDELSELLLYIWLRSQVGEALLPTDLPLAASAA